MKKKLALTATAALLGTLAVGGTLAWFTDTETATNVITTGNVDVKITENLPTEEEQEKGKYTAEKSQEDGVDGIVYGGIEPGTILKKDPVIQYIGVSDAYIRFKINVEVQNADGTAASSDAAKKVKDDIRFFKGDLDVTEAVYDSTKDFQYTTVVYQTGDYVDFFTADDNHTLFDSVQFSGGNELADAGIRITIQADAIQADNLPDLNGNGMIDISEIRKAFDDGEILQYKDDVAVQASPSNAS